MFINQIDKIPIHHPQQSSSLLNKTLFNTSKNMNSPKIFKFSNKKSLQKLSSIQSIHCDRKPLNALLNDSCPIKVIKNHINNSLQHSKIQESKQKIKRAAYIFFDKQKQKRQRIVKQSNYLLPKICIRSKRNYNSTLPQDSNNQSLENQTKQIIKSPIKKKPVVKKHEISYSLNMEDEVENKTKIYKQKCEAQLKNLIFKISDNYARQKCFFDLSSDFIDSLYQKENTKNYKEQNEIDKIEQIDGRKFKIINYQKQNLVEQNKSVPLFLMERLSLKDLNNIKRGSFITEAPRNYVAKYRQKKQNQNITSASNLR